MDESMDLIGWEIGRRGARAFAGKQEMIKSGERVVESDSTI